MGNICTCAKPNMSQTKILYVIVQTRALCAKALLFEGILKGNHSVVAVAICCGPSLTALDSKVEHFPIVVADLHLRLQRCLAFWRGIKNRVTGRYYVAFTACHV